MRCTTFNCFTKRCPKGGILRLFVGFRQTGGGITAAGGGGAEMLAVGPGKGRIAAETGTEAALRGAHALADQLPGQDQPAFSDIGMDGGAGFGPEGAHHVVFTDVEMFRQSIHGQILGQMPVNVAKDPEDPVVLWQNGVGLLEVRPAEIPADFNQESQQQAAAEDDSAVFTAGKFPFQSGGQVEQIAAFRLLQAQYMAPSAVETFCQVAVR